MRFYKTPPRYGTGMSSVVRRSMEFAIILHILFGIYMYSNSQILTYSMNTDFGKNFSNFIKSGTEQLSIEKGISWAERFSAPHVIFYYVFLIIYVAAFILAKIMVSVFGRMCPIFPKSCLFNMCKCVGSGENTSEDKDGYIENVYECLNTRDLERELDQLKIELNTISQLIQSNDVSESDKKDLTYLKSKFDLNLSKIKQALD